MAGLPTLETERLILRVPQAADWEAYAAFMASERAVHMGGPFEEKAAWAMFCHDVAQWQLFGHGSLMIEERQSGICIGQVGINAGPLFPEHELGWLLYADWQGRGYALEAASRLLYWTRGTLRPRTLVSYVHRDNVASRRLAERLGGVLDVEAERYDLDDLVYRHW